MNRKQFILSKGATCDNWSWSWSFVNHKERFVIFGAWDVYTKGKKTLIFSEEWQVNRAGRKSAGYTQSRDHLRLVEAGDYRLFTFPMKYSEELEGEDGTGPAKIEEITPELHEKLLFRIGSSWYAGEKDEGDLPLAEEISPAQYFPEGSRVSISINAYERNPKARQACIAYHGLSCSVCGFNFREVYGALGEGFIHVHHLKPCATIHEEYVVDPKADLIPVCPNCHAMLHRVEPPLSVEALKELLHLSEDTNP